jgi:hypothetical protein
MKLLCPCSAEIRDQTDDLPYAAELIRDQDWEGFWGTLVRQAGDYAEAVHRGQRDAWIDEHLSPVFPKTDTDADVIAAVLSKLKLRYAIQVYECERCGRVLIERRAGSDAWAVFSPDSGRPERVLDATEALGTAESRGPAA